MEIEIPKYIRGVRKSLGLIQSEFGHLIWPDDPTNLVQGRIAKYETGKANPPLNIYLKIQELEKSTAVSSEQQVG